MNRPSLDPDADTMRRVGYELIDRFVDHACSLSRLRAMNAASPSEYMAAVDGPLPENGSGLSDCLQQFFQRVVPGMTHVCHPRFHGWIPAPSSFAGALGMMLAAATNPFTGTWLGGATVTALEQTVLRWIAEMLDFDPQAAGILTSGGSMANLTALAAARTRWTDRTKMPGVYVSSEGHASVIRAASLLGFPEQAMRILPADDSFRMSPERLRRALQQDVDRGCSPVCVVASAGTTNLGTVDPLSEIAQVCREYSVWFHVDGAYGGFAGISDTGRRLLKGMSEADSLTLDPHKWLYCPVGVGCVLVRDRGALRAAFSSGGDYLRDLPRDAVNPYEFGPELSRPARVLPVWMVLRSAGRAELARQIEQDMQLARLAARLLQEDDRFEVVPPTLSVVGFRHRPRQGESEAERAARDHRLLQRLRDEGDVVLSSTLSAGRSLLRLVVLNHRTTETEIRYSVSRIRNSAL